MRRPALSLLALGGILLLGFAGLVRSSEGCGPAGCPMMKMMQAASSETAAPCPGHSAISATMDCCTAPPASAPAGAPSLASPDSPAAPHGDLPPAVGACPRLGGAAAAAPYAHRALLHGRGLYTLHSVFRI